VSGCSVGGESLPFSSIGEFSFFSSVGARESQGGDASIQFAQNETD